MPRGGPFTAKLRTYYQSLFGHSTQSSRWSSKRGDLDDGNKISEPTGKRAKHYRTLSEGNSDKIILTSFSPGDGSCVVNGTEDHRI